MATGKKYNAAAKLVDREKKYSVGDAFALLPKLKISDFYRTALSGSPKAREYILAGDAFQIVLSQRFQTETTAHPFDIYRALRVVNPSPFMFYFRAGQVTLVGASPEIMCRVENGAITNRPT